MLKAAEVLLAAIVACGLGCAEQPTKAAKGEANKSGAAAKDTDKANEKDGKAKSAADQAEPAGQTVKGPSGMPPVPIPADNPMTPEKIELGKMLYFDTRLSKDGTVSCATCHDPKTGWAERDPVSTGIGKQKGGRNSPTVINAAYATSMFWDGRAKTLEEQALGPIANPIEMGHTVEAMVADLSKIDAYKDQFQKVFGSGITAENVAKAIAAFERTVLSGNSPYDKFLAGDKSAMTQAQERGMQKFNDAGCASCHKPPVMSNWGFYAAGIGADKPKPDAGRMEATKKPSDEGKFRVPALREVEHTGPYFHDGSAATLEDAVAVMAAGGVGDSVPQQLRTVRKANLSAADRQDLVAFLKALSGEYPVVEPPKLP